MTDLRIDSLALRGATAPDWADAAIHPLPENATTDPRAWAEALFDVRGLPVWIRGLFALRQVVVPLIGVKPGSPDVFAVRTVSDGEALLAADDRHLDWRCSVAVDDVTRRVQVTTAVWLHGWRGRVYFAPVSLLHGPILQSMLRRTADRLTPA